MAAGDRGSWRATGFTPRRVMIVAALFIVGYFGVSIASNAITHVRLARQETALRQEIGALERREARLQALRGYMESDAFVEAVARENGLVRPGEVAVVTVSSGRVVESEALQPGDPWWFRYLHESDRR